MAYRALNARLSRWRCALRGQYASAEMSNVSRLDSLRHCLKPNQCEIIKSIWQTFTSLRKCVNCNSIQFTLCTVKYSVHYTEWSIVYTMRCEIQYTPCTVKYSVHHTRWSTVYTMRCEVQCTKYTVKYSVDCAVQCLPIWTPTCSISALLSHMSSHRHDKWQ